MCESNIQALHHDLCPQGQIPFEASGFCNIQMKKQGQVKQYTAQSDAFLFSWGFPAHQDPQRMLRITGDIV